MEGLSAEVLNAALGIQNSQGEWGRKKTSQMESPREQQRLRLTCSPHTKGWLGQGVSVNHISISIFCMSDMIYQVSENYLSKTSAALKPHSM